MTCGLLTVAFTTLALVPGEAVIIGTEAPYAPHTYLSASGEITGFDRDIGDEVCRRAQLSCTWEAARFDELLPGVMSGRFDIAIAAIGDTPARREIVDLTDPYLGTGGTDDYLGRPGAPAPDAARIGVQSGTMHHDHLAATGRRFATYPTVDALAEALVAGEIDLAYGGWQDGLLADLSAKGIEPLYQENLTAAGISMAICKGNSALLAALNAAIAGMWADGTIDAFSARWFVE